MLQPAEPTGPGCPALVLRRRPCLRRLHRASGRRSFLWLLCHRAEWSRTRLQRLPALPKAWAAFIGLKVVTLISGQVSHRLVHVKLRLWNVQGCPRQGILKTCAFFLLKSNFHPICPSSSTQAAPATPRPRGSPTPAALFDVGCFSPLAPTQPLSASPPLRPEPGGRRGPRCGGDVSELLLKLFPDFSLFSLG